MHNFFHAYLLNFIPLTGKYKCFICNILKNINISKRIPLNVNIRKWDAKHIPPLCLPVLKKFCIQSLKGHVFLFSKGLYIFRSRQTLVFSGTV